MSTNVSKPDRGQGREEIQWHGTASPGAQDAVSKLAPYSLAEPRLCFFKELGGCQRALCSAASKNKTRGELCRVPQRPERPRAARAPVQALVGGEAMLAMPVQQCAVHELPVAGQRRSSVRMLVTQATARALGAVNVELPELFLELIYLYV